MIDIGKFVLVWYFCCEKGGNEEGGMNNKGQSCYARSPSHVWAVVPIKVGLIVIDNRQHDKKSNIKQGAIDVFKLTTWGTAASGIHELHFLEYTHLWDNCPLGNALPISSSATYFDILSKASFRTAVWQT